MTTLLRIDKVTKSFGDLEVLRDVSVELRRGEVLGLVGRSGAGKSTLAGIIAGRSEADSGEITVLETDESGHETAVAPTPETFSSIEQNFTDLSPTITVLDAMFRYLEEANDIATIKTRRTLARSLMIDAGYALGLSERFGDLSPTEQGMVEVVRLLAEERPITIVDEVSETFTAREVDELRHILGKLTDMGHGVIYITHRLDEAMSLCNRIAVLSGGVIADVFDTRVATLDQVTEAVVGRPVVVEPRISHVTDDAMLTVRGLDCGGRHTIDLEVLSGESMGIIGPRDSGVSRLVGALTGDSPRPMVSVIVGDQARQVKSPEDAVALRIGYLSVGDGEAAVSSDEAIARGLLMEGLSSGASFESELAGVMAIMNAIQQSARFSVTGEEKPHLTGGQTQWERIREVIADNGRVLVLEEPTKSLDVQARQDLAVLLQQARAAGKAIIVVSSNASDILTLTDRITVMENNSIKETWDTAEVTEEDIHAVFRS